MFDVLLSLAISFIIAYLAIPAIIKVAESKKLFDVPDERKIHQAHIPSLGGLGIFAGFIIACLTTVPLNTVPEFQYFFAAAIVIFFLGIKDDILIISPVKKFMGQLLATFLIINKGGIQITSMHGFLGLHELPPMFSLFLTYFTVLVIINSFNLIDGIDGLAGTLGVMTTTLFGLYFLKSGLVEYAVMSFSLAGSLVAFLIFNYHPARIFMGDTGSMLIGLVNAILAIKFISVAQSPSGVFPIVASPAIGFTLLLIPLMDTLRVFGIRIFHRRSPFSPDRNHIHHLMMDRGWTHNTITFTLVAFNLLFVAFALLAREIGCTWLIFASISVFFAGIAVLYYTRRKPRLFVGLSEVKPVEKKHGSPKVVTLSEGALLEQKN